MTSLSRATNIPTDMKCTHCGSKDTIKVGTTQAKVPKQKYFCKEGKHFFVGPLAE